MAQTNGLGTLVNLPREIRDMVYAHLPNEPALAPVFSKTSGQQYVRHTVNADYLVVSSDMEREISELMERSESSKRVPTVVISREAWAKGEWQQLEPVLVMLRGFDINAQKKPNADKKTVADWVLRGPLNTLLNTKGMKAKDSSAARTGRYLWELDPSAQEWINARRFLKITAMRLRKNPNMQVYMQLPDVNILQLYDIWFDYPQNENHILPMSVHLASLQAGTESSFGYALTLVGLQKYLDDRFDIDFPREVQEIEDCVDAGDLKRIEDIATII